MGGFVLLFSRDGAPIPKHWCEAALAALTAPHGTRAGRYFPWGFTGTATLCPAAEAPEALQLLHNEETKTTTLLDGRIDNPDDLARKTGRSGITTAVESFAAGMNRTASITALDALGSYCALQVSARDHTVKIMRDYLGDRTCFYFLDAHHLIAASELGPLLAIPEIGRELDKVRLAAYFGGGTPPEGLTFFSGIRELPAGSILTVRTEDVHWRPRPPASPIPDLQNQTSSALAERHRHLIQTALACRIDGVQKPALSLSGGLDSGSIAATAVHGLGRNDLQAFSFVFDTLPASDERDYITDLIRELDLTARLIPCDDAWPLKDFLDWPHNPETPEENPYRLLKERVYSAASAAGCRVLLTGAFGDPLYVGGNYWLIENLTKGRWRHAAKEAAWHFRTHGGMRFLRSAAFKRLLGAGRRRAKPAAWLTPEARGLLPNKEMEPNASRPDQHAALLGAYAAHGSSAERFHANRHGLILRHPFRDLRLVCYALGLPVDQLYRRGVFKIVLRNAMANQMPDSVRLRTAETPLTPLFKLGLKQEGAATAQELLQHGSTAWQEYVDAAWVADLQTRPFANEQEALAYWNVLCFIRWHRG